MSVLRLDSAPAVALIDRVLADAQNRGHYGCGHKEGELCQCKGSYEDVLGISRQAVHRLRTKDTVTHNMADRLATHLGYHPSAIWGDAWYPAQD